MSVTFIRTFDELELRNLIESGFTEVKLYYANSPEMSYADTSATASPVDLDTLLAQDEAPYTMSFTWAGGNYSQWFKFIPTGSIAWDHSLSSPFHGGGGVNLLTLRQKVGLYTENMIKGTTTALGSPTTAICTSNHIKKYSDDYFGGTPNTEGWYFHNLSSHEWDEITNFVQSTGTFTFRTGMTTVASGTDFELWRMWDPDRIKDSINWAIVNSYPQLNKPIIDYGFATEENKYQMFLPNDILTVYRVEMEADNYPESTDYATRGHPWEAIPANELIDSLQKILEFKTSMDAEIRIRVTGSGLLSRMYNDSDYTEIRDPQVDILIYKAISYLYQQMAGPGTSTDVDRWREQYTFYKGLYEDMAKALPVKRPSKMNWSPDSQWKGVH